MKKLNKSDEMSYGGFEIDKSKILKWNKSIFIDEADFYVTMNKSKINLELEDYIFYLHFVHWKHSRFMWISEDFFYPSLDWEEMESLLFGYYLFFVEKIFV